jgi:hypothetical protein
MSKRDFIGGGKGFVLEDVGGSFQRLLEMETRYARARLHDAVDRTAFALQQRMKANAPVGPEAPHIKDDVTYKTRGQAAQVGFIDATEPAAPGNPASQADVALYNEYNPNQQPFMMPAAETEARDFMKRIEDAISLIEKDLSGGGGLL